MLGGVVFSAVGWGGGGGGAETGKYLQIFHTCQIESVGSTLQVIRVPIEI